MLILDTNGSITHLQNSTQFKEVEDRLLSEDAGKFYCIDDWGEFKKDRFYNIIEETMHDFTVDLNGEFFKFERDSSEYRDYLIRTKFDKEKIRNIQLEKL